jgi:hypothetical protein
MAIEMLTYAALAERLKNQSGGRKGSRQAVAFATVAVE